MIARAQFLNLIEAADASASYSSKELAELLEVPVGTLNGWLSDKRAFPPAEVGARKRRVYDSQTIKRIAVYADCLENGYGMDASDVRLMISSLDVNKIWLYYVKGVSEFASCMVSQKSLLIGGFNA